MKKRILATMMGLLMGSVVLFGACGPTEDPHKHVDADNDGVCDECREQIASSGNNPDDNLNDDPNNDPNDPDNKPDDGNKTEKTVKSIKVQTKPTKSEYVIGDEFSIEGGELLVTYTDGTEEVISMSASGVKVTPPGLSASGTKSVKVEYGGKSTTYTVKVVNKSYNVTFNENYEGAPESHVESVLKGKKVDEYRATRVGYTLYGWFINADYTERFDFGTAIDSDITLYALWTEDGAEYDTVTFDYDYYGAKFSSYSYPVKRGDKVAEPAVTPERYGYEFVRWNTEDGTAYNFDTTVRASVKIVASWNRTLKAGVNTFIFEAEESNLTGKVGTAFSGNAVEGGMIITKENRGASGDRAVSYLYQESTLEFDFVSDVAVSDAKISLSLSMEHQDFTFTPESMKIYLNGVSLDYGSIAFKNVPGTNDNDQDCLPFEYFLMGENLPLKQGANQLQIEICNTAWAGVVGILQSAGPVVDCMKVETSAVLMWDGYKGCPYKWF